MTDATDNRMAKMSIHVSAVVAVAETVVLVTALVDADWGLALVAFPAAVGWGLLWRLERRWISWTGARIGTRRG